MDKKWRENRKMELKFENSENVVFVLLNWILVCESLYLNINNWLKNLMPLLFVWCFFCSFGSFSIFIFSYTSFKIKCIQSFSPVESFSFVKAHNIQIIIMDVCPNRYVCTTHAMQPLMSRIVTCGLAPKNTIFIWNVSDFVF